MEGHFWLSLWFKGAFWYMRIMEKEIIDMHCHLLPGADDGAKDMKDTMKALHMAREQGVKKIIMTPHFRPEKRITAEQVIALTGEVRSAVDSENIRVEIFSGMECLYFNELPSLLERGEVLPLAGSRYVLVEFLEQSSYLSIERGLESIADVGFIPILAHYERYRSLMQKERVKRLKNKGFLLQMNYDTIQRVYGILKRNPFLNDVRSGYVDFLGSDCHGSSYRKYFLKPSIRWMERNLDESQKNKLIYGNPMMIIDHKYYK